MEQTRMDPSESVMYTGDTTDASGAFIKNNLIVNYLPQSMTENGLRLLFQPFGEIVQCKIVCDRYTRQSLGYGFVRYDTAESAQEAINNLNGITEYPGVLLENKRIKVSHARPASKEITRSNLYISGIPLTWTSEQLATLLAEFGEVIESRVLFDPVSKKPRGVGFCRLGTHSSAQAAINALSGNVLSGGLMPLLVKFVDPPHPRRMQGFGSSPPMNPYGFAAVPHQGRFQYQSIAFNRPINMFQQSGYVAPFHPAIQPLRNERKYPGVCLFIYHLPQECTEQHIQQLFSSYGTVLSAKVMKDLNTGRNKGFGFVNMLNDQQAQLAIQGLNGYQMGNKFLKVSPKT